MAWPFSNIAAPNKDSGFVAVPTGSAAAPTNFDTSTQYWLMGMFFSNDTDVDVNVQVLDGSGSVIIPHARVPARDVLRADSVANFMPVVGLQWLALGVPAGGVVNGKVWAYA